MKVLNDLHAILLLTYVWEYHRKSKCVLTLTFNSIHDILYIHLMNFDGMIDTCRLFKNLFIFYCNILILSNVNSKL